MSEQQIDRLADELRLWGVDRPRAIGELRKALNQAHADGEDYTLRRVVRWMRRQAEQGDDVFDRAANIVEREFAASRPASVALPRQLIEWTDEDKPLPEDEEINAAHPTRSGAHDAYAEAMRLVGAKRSKAALVDLVCWLLQERDRAEEGWADERSAR